MWCDKQQNTSTVHCSRILHGNTVGILLQITTKVYCNRILPWSTITKYWKKVLQQDSTAAQYITMPRSEYYRIKQWGSVRELAVSGCQIYCVFGSSDSRINGHLWWLIVNSHDNEDKPLVHVGHDWETDRNPEPLWTDDGPMMSTTLMDTASKDNTIGLGGLFASRLYTVQSKASDVGSLTLHCSSLASLSERRESSPK